MESIFCASRRASLHQRSTINHQLLRHFRGVRTVFLKHARRRKLAELVTDHVFRHEDGVKNLPAVNEEGVSDKIRRDR